MTTRRTLAVLALASVALRAAPTFAEPTPRQREASEHFKRGTAAFDEKRYGDALDEFEKAYAVVPAFAVLYNLGQVHVLLGHPVEAADAFEKYLAQGAGAIPLERRAAVEKELETQRAKTGQLTIAADPPSGAENENVAERTAPVMPVPSAIANGPAFIRSNVCGSSIWPTALPGV